MPAGESAPPRLNRVVQLGRRPVDNNFSLERVFESVRAHWPASSNFSVVKAEVPFASRGIWKRLLNALWTPGVQADIVHITGDIHYCGLLARPERTILSMHDCALIERSTGLKRAVLKKLWYDLPLRRVSFIVTGSNHSKQRLLTLCKSPHENISVIANPVPTHFRFEPKEQFPDSPIILQVGTGWNKNLERVISALSGLDCQLHIIGKLDSSHLDALERSRVHYRNYPSPSDAEVVDCYRLADIICFTSIYEGFGMPIIESNAMGRPVITSNLTSMPEVAGEAAIVVDPYNVFEIRQAVLGLMENPTLRNELVGRGELNARRFSGDVIARQYEALYASVLHKQKKHKRGL